MKKTFAIVAVIAAIFASTTFVAQAATPARSGADCKKVNTLATVQNQNVTNQSTTFKCVKVGKKMVWNAGVVNYKVKTLLTVSQVWTGSKVTLSILDSNGVACESSAVASECSGFYLGWSANFDDANRTVSYGESTSISGMQIGDKGSFQLKWQEKADSMPIIVKTFPFSYNY
jgi:hypothetical protein